MEKKQNRKLINFPGKLILDRLEMRCGILVSKKKRVLSI